MERRRLSIDVPMDLHKEIKKRATFKNQSIRDWIIRAALEQIRREKATE